MENTDIPQFHTYRGEIEFEGTLIQADIFIDNKSGAPIYEQIYTQIRNQIISGYIKWFAEVF